MLIVINIDLRIASRSPQSLAKMSHHPWGELCLAGIAGKAREQLHVFIFSNLLDCLLVCQAQPLLDEQRTKSRPYRLSKGASCRVELRSICLL